MSALLTVGAVIGGGLILNKLFSKPKRKKKKTTSGEPWDQDVVADLEVLAGLPRDTPSVQLEPGGVFWLRINETSVGARAAEPFMDWVGDCSSMQPNTPLPVEIGTEQRRGTTRYVPFRATQAGAGCVVDVAYDTNPPREQDKFMLGFQIAVTNSDVAIGSRSRGPTHRAGGGARRRR